MTTVSIEAARAFCSAALKKAGVPDADARLVADSLVQAEIRGVTTHGLARLRGYLDRIRAGGMKPETHVSVLRDGGATLTLEGGGGIGQVVAAYAMKMAIERAKLHGIACVAVRGSNHLGALSYYSRMALGEDMIGFAASGSAPMMPPHGGLTRLLSTGPWSIAIPAGDEYPIVVDQSNASINPVKVRRMRREDRLPPGIALDERGEPTEDPIEALKGVILPIGGHKGYGLVLVLEVLSSVLTGAAYSVTIPGPDAIAVPQDLGHLILAFRIDRFIPIEEFKSRVDHLIRMLHASATLRGMPRVLVPGERSELLARQRANGIPLCLSTIEVLRDIAKDLSIEADFLDHPSL